MSAGLPLHIHPHTRSRLFGCAEVRAGFLEVPTPEVKQIELAAGAVVRRGMTANSAVVEEKGQPPHRSLLAYIAVFAAGQGKLGRDLCLVTAACLRFFAQ